MLSKVIKNSKVSPARRRSSRGLKRYLETPKAENARELGVEAATQERCEFKFTNCTSWATADTEMDATAGLARSDDPFYHVVVSWPSGEKPSEAEARAVVDHKLKALGFHDHQYLAAMHSDTDNSHIHIVVNRVHPDTLKTHHPRGDFFTLDRTDRELELAFGWRHDRGVHTVVTIDGVAQVVRDNRPREDAPARVSKSAAEFEERTGGVSFQTFVQDRYSPKIKAALRDAKNWNDVHAAFAAFGLEYRKFGGGAVVVGIGASEELRIKASSISSAASMSKLEKRFGAFQPVDHAALERLSGNVKATDEYRDGADGAKRRQKQRFARSGRREKLDDAWDDYQRHLSGDRGDARAFRRQVWDEYKKMAADEREALRLRASERRVAVRDIASSGAERAALYRDVAARNSAERAALRVRLHDERKALNLRLKETASRGLPRRQWLEQIAMGDDELAEAARAELRGVRYSDRREGGAICGVDGETATRKPSAGMARYSWRDDGESNYFFDKNTGELRFVDHGRQIVAARFPDRDDITAMLQLSAEKWRKFEIMGGESFRRRAAAIAIDLGLEDRVGGERIQEFIAEIKAQREEQGIAAGPAFNFDRPGAISGDAIAAVLNDQSPEAKRRREIAAEIVSRARDSGRLELKPPTSKSMTAEIVARLDADGLIDRVDVTGDRVTAIFTAYHAAKRAGLLKTMESEKLKRDVRADFAKMAKPVEPAVPDASPSHLPSGIDPAAAKARAERVADTHVDTEAEIVERYKLSSPPPEKFEHQREAKMTQVRKTAESIIWWASKKGTDDTTDIFVRSKDATLRAEVIRQLDARGQLDRLKNCDAEIRQYRAALVAGEVSPPPEKPKLEKQPSIPKEEIDAARSTSIGDILQRAGYVPHKEGNQVRWQNAQKNKDATSSISVGRPNGGQEVWIDYKLKAQGAGAIDLYMHLYGGDWRSAVKAIRNDDYKKLEPVDPVFVERKPDVTDVQRVWTESRAMDRSSPLLEKRGIDRATLDVLGSDRVRVDAHGNVIFAHRDRRGNVTGFDMVGERYKGFSKGGVKGLLEFGAADPERIVVVESSIKALALSRIEKREGLAAKTRYVTMSGQFSSTQIEQLAELRAEFPNAKLISAFDNDKTGRAQEDRAEENPQIRFHSRKTSVEKDWDDDLVRLLDRDVDAKGKTIPQSERLRVMEAYRRAEVSDRPIDDAVREARRAEIKVDKERAQAIAREQQQKRAAEKEKGISF